MMISPDNHQVITCKEFAKDYAHSFEQSDVKSNYPAMPSYEPNNMTMTSPNNHQTATCEDIQKRRENQSTFLAMPELKTQNGNQSSFPNMPKSMSTPCIKASTREDISIKQTLVAGQGAQQSNYPTILKLQPNSQREDLIKCPHVNTLRKISPI